MNTNKNMLTRLSNSTVGRALRRLFGDECGQGMMEYVIIAVVIAAAAALVFAIWGKSIIGMGSVGAQATMGNPNGAAETAQAVRPTVNSGLSEGKQAADKIHGDVKTKTLVRNN